MERAPFCEFQIFARYFSSCSLFCLSTLIGVKFPLWNKFWARRHQRNVSSQRRICPMRRRTLTPSERHLIAFETFQKNVNAKLTSHITHSTDSIEIGWNCLHSFFPLASVGRSCLHNMKFLCLLCDVCLACPVSGVLHQRNKNHQSACGSTTACSQHILFPDLIERDDEGEE